VLRMIDPYILGTDLGRRGAVRNLGLRAESLGPKLLAASSLKKRCLYHRNNRPSKGLLTLAFQVAYTWRASRLTGRR